jgi:hypothetical protein
LYCVIWFWYQGHPGFMEWVWKCSSPFHCME